MTSEFYPAAKNKRFIAKKVVKCLTPSWGLFALISINLDENVENLDPQKDVITETVEKKTHESEIIKTPQKQQ